MRIKHNEKRFMQYLKCKTSELPIWMTQVTYLCCLRRGCWMHRCLQEVGAVADSMPCVAVYTAAL